MRIDLLLRYLNSASSSQARFHNNVSSYLNERNLDQSQLSGPTLIGTNGYDSQDIEHFKYLTDKIEQNLKITRATIKILEENLDK